MKELYRRDGTYLGDRKAARLIVDRAKSDKRLQVGILRQTNRLPPQELPPSEAALALPDGFDDLPDWEEVVNR